MKKINLGMVLIVIISISLVFFVTLNDNAKVEERKKIEAMSKKYFTEHTKYFMLEEEYRDINKPISSEEYTKYLSRIKKEISEYVIDYKLDEIFEKYKKVLDSQLDGKYMLKQYEREIISVKDYSSDGTYIYILFDTNYVISKDNRLLSQKNKKTGRYEGNITETILSQPLADYMLFKKVNNEYKVIYDTTIIFEPEYVKNEYRGL